MAIQTGVAKKLALKKEASWGANPPVDSGSAYMRRVTSSLDLKKATYQSNEIRSDFQKGDFRHGVRSVEGTIEGELSPKSYQWLWSAALRKVFTTPGADKTGATVSVAAKTNGVQAITGLTGMFASGIKVGGVCRFTAGTIAAGSQSRNLFITALTDTSISVMVMDGGADLATESSKTGCTLNFPGMRSFVPLTAHTDDSFAIEHWYNDILQSECFIGCKVSQIDVSLPPSGMGTIKISFMGKDMLTKTTTAQFATPTAAPTTGVLAAVNGVLSVAGTPVALLTGLDFSLKANMSVESVVGSNTTPGVFPGSIEVTGNATVLFQDATFRDYFVNETEVALAMGLTTGNAGTADFMTFVFPRVKVGGAGKNDGQKGLVMTMPWVALLPADGGNTSDHEQTTMWMQDSAAVTGV